MRIDDSISSTWWLIAIGLTLVLLGMLLLVATREEEYPEPDGAALVDAVAHVGPAVMAVAMGGDRCPPAPARRAPYAGRHRSEP